MILHNDNNNGGATRSRASMEGPMAPGRLRLLFTPYPEAPRDAPMPGTHATPTPAKVLLFLATGKHWALVASSVP